MCAQLLKSRSLLSFAHNVWCILLSSLAFIMVMKHSVESFSSDFSITTLIKGKVRYAQDRTTVPTRHLVRKCQMKCNLFFLISSCESLWFPGEKSVFSDERTNLDYHKCVVASYITSCLSIAKWVRLRKILNEMEWWRITAPTTFQIHSLKITQDEASLRAFVMTSCVINMICSTYY